MDFTRALTFPFDDDEWLKKLGIATLVQFIPLIGQIILQGWSYEISRRVRAGDPKPLPAWEDFGEFLRQGAILFVANLVYQIPTVIFGCIAAFAWVLPALGADTDAAEALAGLGVAAIVCCSCVVFLYAIAAAAVYYGGYVRYIDNPQFSTFMQFGENFALVRDNIGDFGMAVVYLLGAGLLAGLASSITAGILGLIYTPFIMYFIGHVLGQLSQKLRTGMAPAV